MVVICKVNLVFSFLPIELGAARNASPKKYKKYQVTFNKADDDSYPLCQVSQTNLTWLAGPWQIIPTKNLITVESEGSRPNQMCHLAIEHFQSSRSLLPVIKYLPIGVNLDAYRLAK